MQTVTGNKQGKGVCQGQRHWSLSTEQGRLGRARGKLDLWACVCTHLPREDSRFPTTAPGLAPGWASLPHPCLEGLLSSPSARPREQGSRSSSVFYPRLPFKELADNWSKLLCFPPVNKHNPCHFRYSEALPASIICAFLLGNSFQKSGQDFC